MVDDAVALVGGLGGPGNIVEVEPCVLRIRVEVRDPGLVDEDRLRIPGVLAVVRSGHVVQIVAGTASDGIAERMDALVDVAQVTAGPPTPGPPAP